MFVSRIIRLTNNQIKSRKELPFPKRRRKRRHKCCSFLGKIVPQLGCVSQDSELLGSQRDGQALENPMQKKFRDQFEDYDSLSLRYVKQESGKRKDHRLEKCKAKFLISEVPTLQQFEDRSQEEIERQQRCARSKAWNLAKHICKLKRKRQSYILLARRRKGTPGCVNKRAGGKRVCGRFRSWYAYGQQERP